MNVLLLRPRVDLGGVATNLALLTKELVARGHRVGIATSGGDALGLLEQAGVSVFRSWLHPSTPLNLVRSSIGITRVARAGRFDILHSTHRFTTIVGRIVSGLTRIPLVVTLHEYHQNARVLAPLWVSDATITPTLALKRHLVTFYGINSEKITVIPHAIAASDTPDPRRYAALCETLGQDSDSLWTGYIGRLSLEKGCQYFVESMPLIKQCMPNVRFLIVGSGPEEKRLRERATHLGFDPSGIFVGTRDDISEILELLDIVVIPSLSESFGMVALEAMRSSRPVVASSVGGLPELVRHGETGLLVPPKSPAALARAVCELLADPEQRGRLGERGRQVFLDEYSLPLSVNRTLEVYERMQGRATKL
jgi:glycosyltransferase involved in cell wall biosynthesis